MADYNRNNRGAYRTSNQDWSEYRGRHGRDEDDERNFGNSSSDYRRSSNREFDDSAGWQSRPERDRDDYDRNSMYNSRYGRAYDYDTNYGSHAGERNYGAPNYGNGNYGSSYSRERNLYDRDYEGMGRRGYTNSGTRLGAGNYGNYSDRNRNFNEGMSQGRGGYGYSGRDYDDRNRGDRNWWDRASDEVSSWFGDDEAERRREQDRQVQGQHKGKGPKNYSRTDDRIKDDVNDRLSDDPFIDASEIEVAVMNGEVTLTGTVDHRSTKRRAEDIAESVSGVKNVENRLRVGQTSDYNNPEKTSQTTASQSTSAVAGSDRTRAKKDYVTG